MAERCREAILNMSLIHQGKPVRVTCSFGVAEQGCEPSMIEAADKALYEAKREGRDRVVTKCPCESSNPAPSGQA
jgi:PleD family two-component response regulator